MGRSRDRDRDRDRDRKSRSRGRGGGRSRSRSRSRGGRGGREERRRSRSGGRGAPHGAPRGGARPYRNCIIPEPPKPFTVTPEERQNSVEFEGRLYASLDFYPPDKVEELSGQQEMKLMPDDWELVPKEQAVIDTVIALHGWSTNFLVLSQGETYWTNRGLKPGKIQMIWDLERSGRLFRPSQRGGLKNYKGRVLIRTCKPVPPP
mmetsp:Transcript_64799/g.182820  ORF Transcript_64799/g.182820 Transcript_64799/m.182820 type:complete len:205 (-) Transcript_64799:48-662(-)